MNYSRFLKMNLSTQSAAADTQHSALSTQRVARNAFIFIVLIGMCSSAVAQTSNSTGTIKWPANPPVGIGTEQYGGPGPMDALHIHYDPSSTVSPWRAILRLSQGASDTTKTFGILGLLLDTNLYSSLGKQAGAYDLTLHQHNKGDIIITNHSQTGAPAYGGTADIRFATTGNPIAERPMPTDSSDLERLTIAANGNIGIDIPPDATGLCTPRDQLQIGGSTSIPGLTIYGGNRFEGLPLPFPMSGPFPVDWRYIAYNHHQDHRGGGGRFQMTGTTGIWFSGEDGGKMDLTSFPFNADSGLSNESLGVTLQMTGNGGLSFWSDERGRGGSDYHHLIDLLRPGLVTWWPALRNTNGLFFHHTPVYIGSDSSSNPGCNLQNLPVRPDMGDDSTWMLVVNGPMLAKEIFVLDTAWADYVFDPSYKLAPLSEVENYVKTNRHLPEIPPASKMAETGVPLGRMEAALTKQVEEMMLYITQLSHKIEALEGEVKDLKDKKEK